ncbi:hypothetical protein BH09BAC2_BH09BAC2_23100 [soil metagenome]
MKKYILLVGLFTGIKSFAQQSPPFSISGTMGVTYEGYGLNANPNGSTFYTPRRPWNQVRFNFTPTLKFGKNFTLPFNFNFTALPTNFAGPYAGLTKQTFGQWLTNPANNFGINPKYKWAELQLGTQYLKYSELSTGDVGIFGAGVSLKPKGYIIKFFTGTSQRGINYLATPLPGVPGAYKRTHYMFQLGKEKEGKYLVAVNFAKGKDKINSITSLPPTTKPQEGFVWSVMGEGYFNKGWFIKAEGANSFFTRDVNQPAPGASFKPFINGKTSTVKDYALDASFGKKSADFDFSYATKYIGAGFQTTGYPYMQPDHWDNTLNTRFNAWKKKINIVASAGVRSNNISNVSLQSQQFIGNLNWFTQFNDKFSLNLNYNNFGFTSAGGLNPYGIKNVSNDMGITPTYTWTTNKMVNVITLGYNYSKYDERDVLTALTTSNNTHTAVLTYIPVFLNSDISPDFSAMYFNNSTPLLKNTLFTLSAGVGLPALKKKMQLKGQLQYTIGKLNAYTPNNNLIASINVDYKITKKLSWNNFITTNYFKYGDELAPPIALLGANYLESTYRSGLKYNF